MAITFDRRKKLLNAFGDWQLCLVLFLTAWRQQKRFHGENKENIFVSISYHARYPNRFENSACDRGKTSEPNDIKGCKLSKGGWEGDQLAIIWKNGSASQGLGKLIKGWRAALVANSRGYQQKFTNKKIEKTLVTHERNVEMEIQWMHKKWKDANKGKNSGPKLKDGKHVNNSTNFLENIHFTSVLRFKLDSLHGIAARIVICS